jgi:hypothetical protein
MIRLQFKDEDETCRERKLPCRYPLSQAERKWQQQIARLDRRRKTNNV